MTYEAIEAIRTRQGRLTDGYEAALKALRACARSYSAKRYGDAMTALQFVVDNDEVADVANAADALSDYCLMAKDKKLGRLAAQVDVLHGRQVV